MPNLYVVVALNSMGPAIDPKHPDLLNDWGSVNRAFSLACQDSYRLRYLDDFGGGIKFSLFCVSWSGFLSNPVSRDFGWHTIFDNYNKHFSQEMKQWGDQLYWMYNHPPESGIGNEWGLDWLQNTHYFNILNHFIIDRGYFPSISQIPTQRNDSSHFLENWIPFDFSNRNSKANNLNSINADGRTSGAVLSWSQAPYDWSHYHPSVENYQIRGDMRRSIFRILDIKSIVHVLTEAEIESAFIRCDSGNDTVICAYEHDFRDRYETIMDLMIKPVYSIKKRYPNVTIKYVNALEAAQAVLGRKCQSVEVNLAFYNKNLRINATERLFGSGPYICVYNCKEKSYSHIMATQIGEKHWQLPDIVYPDEFILGVAAHDSHGNVVVRRWEVNTKCLGINSLLEHDCKLHTVQLVV